MTDVLQSADGDEVDVGAGLRRAVGDVTLPA
jgi:hypothetical protein